MKTLPAGRYYKSYVQRVINTVGTDITFSRFVGVDDGYGGKLPDTEIPVYETVAVYDRASRQYVITDAGVGYKGAGTTMLLARYEADIQRGDIFDVLGYKFRVLFVKPYFNICKQIEIEVVE